MAITPKRAKSAPKATKAVEPETVEVIEEQENPIEVTLNAKVIEANELVNMMHDAQQIAEDQRDRICITTNQEFESVDFKTGEVTNTNSFTLKSRELVRQIAPKCPIVALAKVKALGKRVNPQILAMVLYNADIEAKRTFRKAGEDLDYNGKAYAKDHWHTEITSISTHIDEFFMEEIKTLLREKPAADEPKAATPNGHSFKNASGM